MPYQSALNTAKSLSITDRTQLMQEFDLLRQELDDLRTQYAALLAKLDADAGVTDTDYAAELALADSAFTAL